MDGAEYLISKLKENWDEREVLRRKIMDLRDEMRSLDRVAGSILYYIYPQAEEPVVGYWTCPDPTNLLGICVHDDVVDPMHDECIYCFQPEERK